MVKLTDAARHDPAVLPDLPLAIRGGGTVPLADVMSLQTDRGDPTILKREAETDLLIADGHTAVIGGIYTRNTGRNVDQVPFFGDIPILGVLFQRRRVRDDRNELLIFLTPRIVNRAEALPQGGG